MKTIMEKVIKLINQAEKEKIKAKGSDDNIYYEGLLNGYYRVLDILLNKINKENIKLNK